MVLPSMKTSAEVVDSAVTTVPFWINNAIAGPHKNGGGKTVPHSSKSSLSRPPGFRVSFDFDHLDAVIDRANQRAEVAANAGHLVHARNLRQRHGILRARKPLRRTIGIDALVRAVIAGGHAQSAADAGLGI